jgi:hypothetical protein
MSRYVGLLTSRASRRHLTDHPASAGCPAGSSRTGQDPWASGTLIRAGDVVKWFNTEVCKTSIHRFESGRRLHTFPIRSPPSDSAVLRPRRRCPARRPGALTCRAGCQRIGISQRVPTVVVGASELRRAHRAVASRLTLRSLSAAAIHEWSCWYFERTADPTA